MTTATLDLTGGHLNIKVVPGDGKSFIVPLPSDMTAWTFTATAGLTLAVTATQLTVTIPAAVTASMAELTDYAIRCRLGTGDPSTVLSGKLLR